MAQDKNVDKQIATLTADFRNLSKTLTEFVIEFKKAVQDLTVEIKNLNSLNGKILVLEEKDKQIERDVADLQGRWSWLIRIVAGIVITALVGLVIVSPFK